MKNINKMGNNNLRSVLLALLMLSASITLAQDNVTLSWSEAINLALTANPNLAAARSNLEASAKNVHIARAGYLPSFVISGSLSESKSATFSETAGVLPSTSGLVGASLSQMIYNRNTLGNHKVQKYLYASDQEQFRYTRYSTITNVAQAYIGALVAIDLLHIQEINLAVTLKNLSVSEYRVEVGSTNEQEVLRWKIQKFSNQQDIASQKASILKSYGILNQLLNLPIENTDVLEDLTIEKNGFIFASDVIAQAIYDESKSRIIRDYLVEIGLEKSPQLASIEQQLRAQNRQLGTDKLWAVPNLSFAAGADAKWLQKGDGSDPSSNEDIGFWKVGLKMTWPLVAGGANVSKVKQAKSQLSSLEYDRNNLKTSLDLGIRAAFALVAGDYMNINYANEQATSANQNYELVLDSYYVGESTLLDLIDAQQQKLESEIGAEIAHYTFFIDLINLEEEIGYFTTTESPDVINNIMLEIETRLGGG